MLQVTGASSNLGSHLAEEFARGGCSVICVDEAGTNVETIASTLRAKYPGVECVGRRYRKQHDDDALRSARPSSLAYSCNLWDRQEIKTLAKRVRDDVGRIDVLVTCAGSPDEGVFDTVSRTLMSHYWVGEAFIELIDIAYWYNIHYLLKFFIFYFYRRYLHFYLQCYIENEHTLLESHQLVPQKMLTWVPKQLSQVDIYYNIMVILI